MTVRELLLKLESMHPDADVKIETTFMHDCPSHIMSVLQAHNMIILRDHIVTIAEPETLTAYDGVEYTIPVCNERSVAR